MRFATILQMAEQGRQLASFAGWCRGAKGELLTPVPTTLSIVSGGTSHVECPLFVARSATCEQGGLPCAVTIYDAKEASSLELRNITPFGELVIDPDACEVLRSPLLEEGHAPVVLTASESSIVEMFMRSQGRVLSRTVLLSSFNPGYNYSTRTVDVHIKRLRTKLGQPDRNAPQLIETVKERGYRIPNPPKRPQ